MTERKTVSERLRIFSGEAAGDGTIANKQPCGAVLFDGGDERW